jgi:hypothetical protein
MEGAFLYSNKCKNNSTEVETFETSHYTIIILVS